MSTPEEIKRALDGSNADVDTKRSAWIAYDTAGSPEEFEKNFSSIQLPDATKDSLRKMKYAAPPSLTDSVKGFLRPGTPVMGPPSHPGEQKEFIPPTANEWKGMGVSAMPMIGAGIATALMPEATIPAILGYGALGAAGGEAARQLSVRGIGHENLSGPVYKTDPPPASPGAAAWEIGKEAALAPLTDLGVRSLTAAGRAALAGPLHGAARMPENAAVRASSERAGLNVTPPEIAGATLQGRLARLAQKFGRVSMFSGAGTEALHEAGAENGLKTIDQMLTNLHPRSSPLETGEAVKDVIQKSNQIFRNVAGNMYEQVDQAAAGTMVNILPLKKKVLDIMGKSLHVEAAFGDEVGGLGSSSSKILNAIMDAPNDVSFMQAHGLRANLLQVTPQEGELMAKKAGGIAKTLVGEMTSAMENSSKNLNSKAYEVWRAASEFYKEGADLFGNEAIQGISKMPDGAKLLSQYVEDGAVGTAKRIRSALLDYPAKHGTQAEKDLAEQTYKQFQEQFVRSKLLGAGEQAGGLPEAKAAEQLFGMGDRMKKVGPGVLREIFGGSPDGKAALDNLSGIAHALDRVDRSSGAAMVTAFNATRLFSTLTVGVLVGADKAEHFLSGIGVASVFEFIPWMISKSITNKTSARYLMDGIGGVIDRMGANQIGKGVIKITDKAYEPVLSKYVPPALTNFVRAYEEIQKDRDKMTRKKAADPDKPKKISLKPWSDDNPYE